MITGAERSVLQNPAYRLATTDANIGDFAVFAFVAGASSSAIVELVVVGSTAPLHHARRLHQALCRHPAAREHLAKRAPDESNHHHETYENEQRDGEGDERMVP